jgi:nitroimidazol reductase NimA-like FMN-containing flavoprotein (pyridoxamine 5'-phosphate oxidase superfamily)
MAKNAGLVALPCGPGRPIMWDVAERGAAMIERVLEVLRDNRLAAMATVDPDGWPHCTVVGVANDRTRIYFVIARGSQKLIDIERDDRVSLAIGRDVIDPSSIRALAIKARASTVEDPAERKRALELLFDKRPALKKLDEPSDLHSAVMVAVPEEIRLLDYSKGYGHSTLLKLDPGGEVIESEDQVHHWGYGSSARPVT